MRPAGDIVVYNLGWLMDAPAEGEENPNALLHARVVVDGVEIKCVSAIEVKAEGNEFAAATLRLNPSRVRFVALDEAAFHADDLPEASE